MSNKIELSGIFSEGYGIIPKKLMRAKIDKNIKLILSYMLSYTGGGNECFPSIRTMASDLGMSSTTIVKYIKSAEDLSYISKSKLYPNNPLNHANKYKMVFFDVSLRENTDVSLSNTPRITECNSDVPPIETTMCQPVIQNKNNINNNSINNIKDPYIITDKKDTKSLTYTEKIKEIISYLNSSLGENGKKYRNVEGNAKHIRARLNEGYTVDDFKKVIDNKKLCPYFQKNPLYYRPETLFSPKFEGYLNERAGSKYTDEEYRL